MENKINFQIPAEVLNQAGTKLAEALTLLSPYLIALSPDERREVPKMGDDNVPFVEKIMDYSATSPQFTPAFMDRNGLTSDMDVYKQLRPLLRTTEQLYNGLSDTMMEAGAESYVCALAYYNAIKQANKMNIPGAKAIYEDLSKRFKNRTASKNGSSES